MPTSAEIKRAHGKVQEQRALVDAIRREIGPPRVGSDLHWRCTEIPIAALGCGVYFLIRDGVIVCIGQSVSVGSRIADHLRSAVAYPGTRYEKRFDRALLMPCPADELESVEGALIRYFAPECNGPAGGSLEQDHVIIARLGLPSVHPEIRRLAALQAKLRRLQAARSHFNALPLLERVRLDPTGQIRNKRTGRRTP